MTVQLAYCYDKFRLKTTLNGQRGWKAVSGGSDHACAITLDDLAYCWGSDATGQLANGATTGIQVSPGAVNVTSVPRMTLIASRLNLVIQYAQKSAGSCALQTGFATITTSTPIAFNDNAGVASLSAMTIDANDPTGGTNTAETYHDQVDTISNPSAVVGNNRGLWDFSLKDNAAPGNTTYCIRFATSDGTALGTYNYIAEITTALGGGGPTLDQQLRGGQAVVNGIKSVFNW